MRKSILCLVLVTVIAAGCGDSTGAVQDDDTLTQEVSASQADGGVSDIAKEVQSDAGAGSDSVADVAGDTGSDSVADVAVDAGSDSVADVAGDAGADSGADVAGDTAGDTLTDADTDVVSGADADVVADTGTNLMNDAEDGSNTVMDVMVDAVDVAPGDAAGVTDVDVDTMIDAQSCTLACAQGSCIGQACVCVAGWDGALCDVNINDCTPNPCINGTCADAVDGFTCACLPGFTGDPSAGCTDIDDCIGAPCGTGTCDDTGVNSFACDCSDTGFTGPTCAVAIDDCAAAPGATAASRVVLAGIIDGPLAMGQPKSIAVYVTEAISDLGDIAVGVAANGNPSSGAGAMFQGQAAAGEVLFMTLNQEAHTAYFGSAASAVDGILSFNGDDAVELYDGGVLVDVYGVVGSDGTDSAWEYRDGWAVRLPGSSASPSFDASQWQFSGPDAVDGCTTNASCGATLSVGGFTTATGPCVHGTCVDGFKSFTCVCDAGWEGDACEADIDDCVGVDCGGHGTCVDGANSHSCDCDDGWSGAACETPTPCQPNPCNAGAACTVSNGTPNCACPELFDGDLCETDYCNDLGCGPHGSCTGTACTCDPAWSGPRCDASTHPCDVDAPCVHGFCIKDGPGYFCECNPGWSGMNCDVDPNPCVLPDPCAAVPFTECVLKPPPLDFACECWPWLTGPDCDMTLCEALDPCAGGNGVCNTHPNGYVCECYDDSVGSTCDGTLCNPQGLHFLRSGALPITLPYVSFARRTNGLQSTPTGAWYTFEVDPGAVVTVDIAAGFDDVSAELVASDGAILATDTSSDLEWTNEAGTAQTLFVRVYANEAGCYDYRVEMTGVVPICDLDTFDAAAPHDTPATAAQLASGVWHHDLSWGHPSTGDDWYVLPIANMNNIVDIKLVFEHAHGDLDLYLHGDDIAHQLLAERTSETDDEVMFITPIPFLFVEDYLYVRVASKSPAACLTYSLYAEAGGCGSWHVSPGLITESFHTDERIVGPSPAKYSIRLPANASVTITATFLQVDGDLDMDLFNPFDVGGGLPAAVSRSLTDNEAITYVNPDNFDVTVEVVVRHRLSTTTDCRRYDFDVLLP